MKEPRGAIVCPTRPVRIGEAVATGSKPGVIVYLKDGSGRLMKQFWRAVGRRALDVVQVQGDAWEVVGSPADLGWLVGMSLYRALGLPAPDGVGDGHPAVARWHFILNVRPPRADLGTEHTPWGDVPRVEREYERPADHVPVPPDASAGVKRFVRLARAGKADRFAMLERERRRTLARDDREAVERAEARQLPH
jgi:hypothetical protein